MTYSKRKLKNNDDQPTRTLTLVLFNHIRNTFSW